MKEVSNIEDGMKSTRKRRPMGHVTLLRTPNPCQTAAPHLGAHPPFRATVRPSRFQPDPCHQQGNFILFPGAAAKTCFLLGPSSSHQDDRPATGQSCRNSGGRNGWARGRHTYAGYIAEYWMKKTDKAEGVKKTSRQTGPVTFLLPKRIAWPLTQPFTVERIENCMFKIFFS